MSLHFRFDANPANIATENLPNTATSFSQPANRPIDLAQFQVSLEAVSGGQPFPAVLEQVPDGDARKIFIGLMFLRIIACIF